MPSSQRNLEIYREIAELEEGRGSAQTRDRFLILAADAALQAGDHGEADALRDRLLAANPHHLLRPYASFDEAMRSADVASYVADLRGCYPPEEAERLLESLRQGGPGPEEEAPGARPSTVPFREEAHRTIEEPTSNLDFLNLERQPASARRKPPSLTEIDVGGAGSGAAADHAAGGSTLPFLPPEDPPTKRKTSLPPRTETPPPVPRTAPSRGPTPKASEPVSAVNSWVATLFFVLLLIVGVALTGYTFARPYLKAPEEYFK
jgi:hypothetical protein